jgi:ectoine hydroxylase
VTVAVDDRYATRVAHDPTIVDRVDPVVWSEVNNPELIGYAEAGYAQFDNALSPADVAACLREIARIESDESLAHDPRIVREQGSAAVRSIFDIRQLSPVVSAAVELSGARRHAQEILGSDVYIHQNRLNYKPGFQGGAFYWHSDFETWHAEDGMPLPRAVSASISLTHNEIYNGPLMISPGSHRRFVQCVGATPEAFYEESLASTRPDFGVPTERDITAIVDECGIDVLTGQAGSMTMFDCNVLHASAGNISPVPRANIFVVFNSIDNRLQEPFSGSEPRPEYLAAR